MGVSGLWALLSPVKQEVSLAKCNGERLAIDLSGWIVQCSQVSANSTLSKDYLCCRGIFFRALSLLSLGIMPIIVLDGPEAPAVKKPRHRREEFYQTAKQYKELLTALGLPVIDSVGEAEKKCAQLNRCGLVDGCLTNDGDVFVYGARVVYKGLFVDKKEHLANKYELANIKTELGLGTDDLIAFALLSGGDMCEGVLGVGKDKYLELMKEHKRNSVGDTLERMQSWKSSDLFTSLENTKQSLPDLPKGRHCSKCLHEGTKQVHTTFGCNVCRTSYSCTESTDFGAKSIGTRTCPCIWHTAEAKVKPFETELKVRRLALGHDPKFPEEAVISEFKSHQDEDNTAIASIRLPNCPKVCHILEEKLKWDSAKTMSYLVPVLIKMFLHGVLEQLNPKPLRITKQCKERDVNCYRIHWEKLSFDEFTTEDAACYTFPVGQELFTSKFPEMAHDFDKTIIPSPVKLKRGRSSLAANRDPKQLSLTDMWKIRKVASNLTEGSVRKKLD